MGEHKKINFEKTDNYGSTSVTDYLFCITTCKKTPSSYQVKLQKEVKSTQKQPNCKKGAAHAKKTA